MDKYDQLKPIESIRSRSPSIATHIVFRQSARPRSEMVTCRIATLFSPRISGCTRHSTPPGLASIPFFLVDFLPRLRATAGRHRSGTWKRTPSRIQHCQWLLSTIALPLHFRNLRISILSHTLNILSFFLPYPSKNPYVLILLV